MAEPSALDRHTIHAADGGYLHLMATTAARKYRQRPSARKIAGEMNVQAPDI